LPDSRKRAADRGDGSQTKRCRPGFDHAAPRSRFQYLDDDTLILHQFGPVWSHHIITGFPLTLFVRRGRQLSATTVFVWPYAVGGARQQMDPESLMARNRLDRAHRWPRTGHWSSNMESPGRPSQSLVPAISLLVPGLIIIIMSRLHAARHRFYDGAWESVHRNRRRCEIRGACDRSLGISARSGECQPIPYLSLQLRQSSPSRPKIQLTSAWWHRWTTAASRWWGRRFSAPVRNHSVFAVGAAATEYSAHHGVGLPQC